ncbi:hypothetical protein BSZ39_11170 [Bowdeniella nasicola]|uniref:Uncharacterized protein n=1 Tax=Bowdeniella nasicola TaxID=208480 RepID=A0A1Q5PZQ8_9ACTO|nr:hypothetical protein BSZ39_11170 [Bowdeniella nasicola]
MEQLDTVGKELRDISCFLLVLAPALLRYRESYCPLFQRHLQREFLVDRHASFISERCLFVGAELKIKMNDCAALASTTFSGEQREVLLPVVPHIPSRAAAAPTPGPAMATAKKHLGGDFTPSRQATWQSRPTFDDFHREYRRTQKV